MKHPRTLLLAGALAVTLLAGCEDKDAGVTIAGEDGTRIDVGTPTATSTAITQTATAEATSGASPAATTETATPAATETATPTATSTPSPTPTRTAGGSSAGGGASGVPYSTGDVRAAMAAAGVGFEVDDEREPLCGDTSVPETAFEAGGSTWALWVYPDGDAREAEWELDDGHLAARVDDCDPPTGFNYFNANLVLVLVEPGGTQSESVRDAFLAVGVAPEEDDD